MLCGEGFLHNVHEVTHSIAASDIPRRRTLTSGDDEDCVPVWVEVLQFKVRVYLPVLSREYVMQEICRGYIPLFPIKNQ